MHAGPLVLPLVQVCDFNLSEILSEAIEEKSRATNPLWLVSGQPPGWRHVLPGIKKSLSCPAYRLHQALASAWRTQQ
jgi:hypothetical protein